MSFIYQRFNMTSLFDFSQTDKFFDILKTMEKEIEIDEDKSYIHRLWAINSNYLDINLVLMLETIDQIFQCSSVHDLKLFFRPMCESNAQEMVVLFSFQLSFKINNEIKKSKIMSYDDIILYTSSGKSFVPQHELKDLTEALNQLVTIAERIDAGLWNDFNNNYNFFDQMTSTSPIFGEYPHLLELKTKLEKEMINASLPASETFLAKRPQKM